MKYFKKIIAPVQDWFSRRHDEKEMKRLRSLGPIVSNEVFTFHRPICFSEFWTEVDEINSCLFVLKPSNSFENKHEYFLKITRLDPSMEHCLIQDCLFKPCVDVDYVIYFESQYPLNPERVFRNNSIFTNYPINTGIKIGGDQND